MFITLHYIYMKKKTSKKIKAKTKYVLAGIAFAFLLFATGIAFFLVSRSQDNRSAAKGVQRPVQRLELLPRCGLGLECGFTEIAGASKCQAGNTVAACCPRGQRIQNNRCVR